jgi:hypothetical protein
LLEPPRRRDFRIGVQLLLEIAVARFEQRQPLRKNLRLFG